MQTNHSPETKDLLNDLDAAFTYKAATKGQRFANLLIDALCGAIVPGFFIGFFFPEMAVDAGNQLLLRLIIYVVYVCYYTVCEGLMDGRTLGKMVTGTRAVMENGEKLTMSKAFIRSLSRIVPFEQFSGFSERPWHDVWTKTMVIVK